MQLEHTTDQNIEFIRLPRRLMMADAKETKKSLHGFIGKKQPLIALDMSSVEFIDSSGLAVLVNCLQTSRRNSGEICLYGMRDTVKALFEITRLHTLFPIVNHRQEALRRLSS
jgi:anti-sigma B factor antagonist